MVGEEAEPYWLIGKHRRLRYALGVLLATFGGCLGYWGVEDLDALSVVPAACLVAAGIGTCTKHWQPFAWLTWLGLGSLNMLNGRQKPDPISYFGGALMCLGVLAYAAVAAGRWLIKRLAPRASN